ncbi:MAG TPA: alanine racemase [Gemmatimonadales bacterium]|nr:alanine racemase [Gemmatimonadales bacterium]
MTRKIGAGLTMTSPSETARAWVDIDLGALVANARALAEACGARLLPMVKANGYGLGAARVAEALDVLDPWGYGVATVDEALALRAADFGRPILVASPLSPESFEPVLAGGFRPAVGDTAMLRAWLSRSAAPFHLEIDTGMSRAGIRWDDERTLREAADALATAQGWEGVFTHFHSADTDAPSMGVQWERFQAALSALPRRPPLVHAANSAAALCGRAYAADLVRPGIFLYGGQARASAPPPRPVAALRARVLAVRAVRAGDTVGYGAEWRAPHPTTIATLGIGYADGLPRATELREGLPPRQVELRGRIVPIVGRVTMDMCMAAVDEGAVAVGDVATLFGGRISLDEQARAAGTVSYELLTSLGSRLPRRYR